MRKIMVLVMVLALAFSLSACSKNQDINQNLMEQVQLDDAEMKDALVELTERLQAQMRISDPEAKAELKVSEEGNCVVVITQNGTESESASAKSIRELFAAYFEAGFFDVNGEVRGFPKLEEPVNKEDTSTSMPSASEIINEVPIEGGSGEIAGFPGEGMLEYQEPENGVSSSEAEPNSDTPDDSTQELSESVPE